MYALCTNCLRRLAASPRPSATPLINAGGKSWCGKNVTEGGSAAGGGKGNALQQVITIPSSK